MRACHEGFTRIRTRKWKCGKGSRLVCHVIALTVGFGLPNKRGHGVEVEKIQFAMITLSACS